MATWKEYQRQRLAGIEKEVPWFVGNKLRAYEFAKRCGVPTSLVYATFDDPSSFDASNAPDHFVCKPLGLHSTMGVMVLERRGVNQYYDHLRKRDLTHERIIEEQKMWWEKTPYKKDYKLVIEERLLNERSEEDVIPMDYKLYCFGDRVELVSQFDRNNKPPRIAWFLKEFEPFEPENYVESDWTLLRPGTPEKPACWRDIVKYSKTISAALKTPFASVDMYATPRGAVLGEITLAPGAPYHEKMYKFKPEFNEYLGDRWAQAACNL